MSFSKDLNIYELNTISKNLKIAIDDLAFLSLSFILDDEKLTINDFQKQCSLIELLVKDNIKAFNSLKLTLIPQNPSLEFLIFLDKKNQMSNYIKSLINIFYKHLNRIKSSRFS